MLYTDSIGYYSAAPGTFGAVKNGWSTILKKGRIMEREYTVAELKKMLLEAEKKEESERKKVEEEKKRVLMEQKEARRKELMDLQDKLNKLSEAYYRDYYLDDYCNILKSWGINIL